MYAIILQRTNRYYEFIKNVQPGNNSNKKKKNEKQ